VNTAELKPDTSTHGSALSFDFQGLRVGIAEYAEGPTGTTVFHFPRRAKAAVDVRGGLPGTYNVDILRLGYEDPILDAIVVAGGSWYGLQAASGVAMAMKTDGLRSGHHTDLANVAGAIIYDFGDRRLNELHPDIALGAAAFRSAKEGAFPLGAHGAGRMAMQGAYFGMPLHSGQGGAFRQIGATKIAAFVVANPLGLIVDRQGHILTAGQPTRRNLTRIDEVLRELPYARDEAGFVKSNAGTRTSINPANTTIGVVITNRKLPYAALQRVGIQVHASMGRAIQPFATGWDGDVLFAVTTDEVDDISVHPVEIGTLAGEVMWDALLTVTSPRPVEALQQVPAERIDFTDLRVGFDSDFELGIRRNGEHLLLEVVGKRAVYGLPTGSKLEARLDPSGRFLTNGPPERPLRDGAFLLGPDGAIGRVVVNIGTWQQIGRCSTNAA
jgi:6-aminohexanoate-oligomer endohydrolase